LEQFLAFVDVFMIGKLSNQDQMRIQTQQTDINPVLLQLVYILNTLLK